MAWAPDYVTASDLKGYVRIDDTDDDAFVALAVTAASRAVDRATNRQFGQVGSAEERLYTARWDRQRRRWVVEVDDLMTEAGLTVTVGAAAVATFDLEPRNAAQKARPWAQIAFTADSEALPSAAPHEVAVTAQWGWTTVPDTIEQATLLQATRLFTRRGAPFGVAGSPEMGSEVRLLAKLDPDVAVTVGPYIRWWSAA